MSGTIQRSNIVQKVWGHEEIIVNNNLYCGKILYLHSGYQSSLHYHPKKHETMYVLSGRMYVQIGTDVNQLKVEGDIIILGPGIIHRFSNPFTHECIFVEFSTPHNDDDVVRLEDSKEIE